MSAGEASVAAHRPAGDRSLQQAVAIALLAAALVFVCILAIGVGPAALPPGRVLAILAAGPHGTAYPLGDTVIVWQIRLPRVLMGALIGATLALAGAVMQGLFRNPLADPGIVGVSSGAALGAVAMIVLGGGPLAPVALLLGPYALLVAAFVGGLLATLVLYVIATRGGLTSVATMLLAGIALGAFAAALTGLMIFGSTDTQLRDITFWSLGGLGGLTWTKLFVTAPVMLAILVAAPVLARGLDALVLGEAEAFHLGFRVQRLKRLAIFLVAAATGAAVAVSGSIGFVGIVVPHLLRLAVGADHRFLLPASALGGGVLLVLADMGARTLVAPAELPIGIITATLGAPFFLWLLLQRRALTGV
ncbi:FecCD family ABC transporter permease [Mangrovibrevibacter kandeliae]|uniref:FecCD family ABC transporter permease n=1 Tax=Mangrovibrevibacter kandeliae TaxID=2968473 RepID=UPI0021175A4F|nr:iron chelate uptake ABC transporter family permease subunit [Aurantimonas sp. MSK8Z-1]MCQ8781578.1 iron ABC transporter permease [Aurantimonas sp. CSK15Z-1]MCW4114352.1 iron ABC transporter permease [Aurantimonas sp. MSK8Z-1]